MADPEATFQTIDWEGIHQRIAAAETALSGLEETDSAVLQQIWARRAALLAKEPAREDLGEQVELIVVQLGRELYGLNAQYVFDIKPLEQLTHVPRVPQWVAGVVNLRGRIYSVLDLGRFFGLTPILEERENQRSGFLVVVEMPEMEIALLVENVLTVEAIPLSKIQELSGTVRGLRPEYVRGVVERINNTGSIQPQTAEHEQSESSNDDPHGRDAKNSALLVVLDLPALLGDPDLVIHEEII